LIRGGIAVPKVLICDDEVKVCKLIKNIIEWDNLGLDFCGFAHTGQKALDMIQELKPDIVITDIRMPDYDGLYLVKHASAANLDVHFIIISGYQYFEYAQTALRFGIVDYLLKPINKEEINNALNITKKRITSEQENQSSHEELMASLNQSLTKIEEYQVHNIIFQEPLVPLSVLCSENKKLYFSSDTFNVCIIKYDSPTEEHFVRANVESAISKTIQYIRTRSSRNIFTDFLCAPVSNNIYCIMNYDSVQKDMVKIFIDQILYEARKFADAFDAIQVTIGVGKPSFSYEEIKESCHTAFDAIHSRIGCGTNRIIYYSHFNISEPSGAILDTQSICALNRHISSCNIQEFSDFLHNAFTVIVSASKLPYSHYQLTQEVFHNFIQQILRFPLVKSDLETWQKEFQHRLEFAWNKSQLSSILLEFFEQYVKEIQEQSDYELDYPIRQAIRYVENNYQEDCSLSAVSEHVHLNQNYFSTLFKQKTGNNFNSYVAQYRIDMAKQLLRGSDKTIQEIASSLTYSDLKHFRHIFKKYVGISPAKFRELYR